MAAPKSLATASTQTDITGDVSSNSSEEANNFEMEEQNVDMTPPASIKTEDILGLATATVLRTKTRARVVAEHARAGDATNLEQRLRYFFVLSCALPHFRA